MPGGWPFGDDVCNAQSFGVFISASSPTNVTGGASAHQKGAWAQVGGLAVYDASLLLLQVISTAATRASIMDLGVGVSSGAVKVLVSNINLYAATIEGPINLLFPVDVPAGQGIWVRLQSATAADAAHYVQCQAFSGGLTQRAGTAGADGIGAVLSTSLGTTVTAGGTANQKGAYVQLSAATAADYYGFYLFASSITAANILVDVAVGAAGSEVLLIGNFYLPGSTVQTAYVFLPIAVKAGSRLAARSASATLSATCYVTLIGLYR